MYLIRDWDRHYENHASRVTRFCRYLYMPNRQGAGFRRLLQAPNGIAHFAAFVLMAEIASRVPHDPEGKSGSPSVRDGRVAAPDGTPYDVEDMAIASGSMTWPFAEALPRLVLPQHKILWVEWQDDDILCRPEWLLHEAAEPLHPAAEPLHPAAEPQQASAVEGKGREGKILTPPSPRPHLVPDGPRPSPQAEEAWTVEGLKELCRKGGISSPYQLDVLSKVGATTVERYLWSLCEVLTTPPKMFEVRNPDRFAATRLRGRKKVEPAEAAIIWVSTQLKNHRRQETDELVRLGESAAKLMRGLERAAGGGA